MRDATWLWLTNQAAENNSTGLLLLAGNPAEAIVGSGASPTVESRYAHTLSRLAAIVREIPVGVAVLSAEHRLLVANDAFHATLGIQSEADRLFWRRKDLSVRDSQHNLLPFERWPINRALRSREVIVNEEIYIERPDGKVACFCVSVAPLKDAWAGKIVVMTILDVTSSKALSSKELADAYKAAARDIVFARESERRRLAKDIHDEFGQSLTLLSLELRALQSVTLPQKWLRRVQRAQTLVQQLSASVHHTATSLRPMALDTFGLRAAIDDLVTLWSGQLSISADIHLDHVPPDGIGAEVAEVLYRVTQEALTNVAKHARAARVSVTVHRTATGLRVAIEDDGDGFDAHSVLAATRGSGLSGMRERLELVGGMLTIESTAGRGATIYADVPIDLL